LDYINEKIDTKNQDLDKFSELKDKIIEKEEKFKIKKEILENKKEKISNIKKSLEDLISKAEKYDKNWGKLIEDFDLEKIEKELDDLKTKIESHNDQFYGIKSELKLKNTKLEEISRELKQIEDLKRDARCPKCKQKVTGEHKAKILEEFNSEKDNLKSKIKTLDSDFKREESLLDKISDEFSLKEKRYKIIQKIIPVSKEISGKKKDIRELESEINEITEEIKKIEIKKSSTEINNQIKEIEEEINNLKDLTSEIKISNEKRKELDSKITEINELKDKKASLSEQFNSEEYDQNLQDFSDKNKELNLISSIEPITQNLMENIKDRIEIQSNLEKISGKIQNLAKYFTLEKYDSLKTELESLKQSYNQKTGSIDELQKRSIPNLRKEIKSLEQEKIELKDIKKQIIHTKRQNNLLLMIRQFCREIPPILREYQTFKISEKATELLKLMLGSSAFDKIIVKNDYELRVQRFGVEEDISQLSGGEQVIICLAIRLAISDVLANRELILLDEPTLHLDDDNIRNLVDIFYQFRPSTQMITITHDSEFEKIADNLLNVQKVNGIKSVIT
jgi:exonuclease SbcC